MGIIANLFSSGLEKMTRNASELGQNSIPLYLWYPYDPIAQKMFEPEMKEIRNKRCRYQFKLYSAAADTQPLISRQNPPFDIHESHTYWKPGSSSWYTITTMKTPAVKTSNLRNWVEASSMFGIIDVQLPSTWKGETVENGKLHYLGDCEQYNQLHGFDEAHTYCYTFMINNKMFKQFMLCAKNTAALCSWKVTCSIETQSMEIQNTDLVVPGMTFGSFFML